MAHEEITTHAVCVTLLAGIIFVLMPQFFCILAHTWDAISLARISLTRVKNMDNSLPRIAPRRLHRPNVTIAAIINTIQQNSFETSYTKQEEH